MIQTSGQRIAVDQRRDGDVDADADQERAGQPGQVLHRDRGQQPPQRRAGAARSSSPSSRRDRARRKTPAPVGELVGVLGGDPAPVLLAVGAVARRRRLRGHGRASDQLAVLRQQVAVGRAPRPAARCACRPRRSGRRPAAPPGRPAAPSTARCATTSAVVAGQHVAQRPLDQRLGVHVERRQRVVEHQHRRAGRAPRGPAPAAAAGRRTATGPARRSGCPAPTAGRARTRPGRPAAPRRRRRRWRPGRPSVRFSRTLIENSVALLEGGRHDAAQLGQRQVADVDAVEGDPAGGDVVAAGRPARSAWSCPSRWRRRGRRVSPGATSRSTPSSTGAADAGVGEADALEAQPGRGAERRRARRRAGR